MKHLQHCSRGLEGGCPVRELIFREANFCCNLEVVANCEPFGPVFRQERLKVVLKDRHPVNNDARGRESMVCPSNLYL